MAEIKAPRDTYVDDIEPDADALLRPPVEIGQQYKTNKEQIIDNGGAQDKKERALLPLWLSQSLKVEGVHKASGQHSEEHTHPRDPCWTPSWFSRFEARIGVLRYFCGRRIRSSHSLDDMRSITPTDHAAAPSAALDVTQARGVEVVGYESEVRTGDRDNCYT